MRLIDCVFPPIDYQAELNEEQYAAVTAKDGPSLVLAGAGSGKTRTLTFRVAYLLEKGVAPWQILLLTFTNKASREMVERVEELTGSTPEWGGTFHSIGARILRQHGDAIGLDKNYTIMDQSDADLLFKEAVQTVDSTYLKNKDNVKPKLLFHVFSFARNSCLSEGEIYVERYPWADNDEVAKVVNIAKVYEKLKRERNICDYDDLLVLWLKLLRDDAIVREFYQNKFKHILVDEFQDTNTLQSAILEQLAGNDQIMAVGDDAQCIYTWRGANFENICRFDETYPEANIFKIETNYRSTPEILELANNVLRADPSAVRYDKELKPFHPSGEKPYIVPVGDSYSQAKFIINRVRGLMDEGYAYSDIAVLYRAHYQAMELQMELTQNYIPFLITSGLKFFEQAHVKDVTAHLRILGNPADSTAFLRVAMLLPKIGEKTALRIHAAFMEILQKENVALKTRYEEGDLFENVTNDPVNCMQFLQSPAVMKKVPKTAVEAWEAFALTMIEAYEPILAGEESSAYSALESIIEGWYEDHLRVTYPNWESRRDDLNSLLGFSEDYKSIYQMLEQLVLLSGETSEKEVDISNKHALRLSTIHQAKGLEFPIVFIIGSADGLFPLKRAIDEGDLDEERRLFYVAATRAKSELYLSYPVMVSRPNQGVMRMYPSRFIQELPDNCYQKLYTR